MNTFFSNLFYSILTLLIFVSLSIGILEFYYNKRGPNETDKKLIVNKGQSVSEIASNLRQLNLIENSLAFILLARIKGFHSKIKFGEYMIPKSASIDAISKIVVSGVSIQHKITIPEGLTSFSIVNLINEDRRIKGDFVEIKNEGMLAPNTYNFDITTTKQNLFSRIENEQKQILQRAWNNKALGLPLKSAKELLILASIVEKEAGNENDKKKVASVFLNRLKRKMRLQSDPTVVYSLTKGRKEFKRALTRDDLKVISPYNTYKVPGLPPNPICNPSVSSIYAVANPIETDFLFFVADGKGGHNFSNNLLQHNRFVKEYRELKLNN